MEQNAIQTTRSTELPIDFWERLAPSESESPARGEELFTADAVIDAYLIGREDLSVMRAIILEKIKENFTRAGILARKILAVLHEHDSKPSDVFLRLEEWSSLDILIIVDEESFVRPGFSKIYSTIRSLRESHNTETFSATIYLMPVENCEDESYNTDALNADGYLFRLQDLPTT